MLKLVAPIRLWPMTMRGFFWLTCFIADRNFARSAGVAIASRSCVG